MAILQEKAGLTNEDIRKIRCMHPGMSIDLQVTTASSTKRVRTEFIGMDGTRNMIIRFPDETKWGSLRDALYTEANIIIRYILEDETGEVIAFKVKIILVLTKPSHMIFTTFPLAIQSHDLRTEQRAKTSIPASLLDSEEQSEICVCLVRDLSSSGCRISVERSNKGARPTNKQGIIMCFSPSNGADVMLKGTVMNTKADEVSYFYGIKFDSPASEVRALMNQLMISSN
jgi:hypothetical protein